MNFMAKTRLLTLLGDPVMHSRSPEIQNKAFEAAGGDGEEFGRLKSVVSV